MAKVLFLVAWCGLIIYGYLGTLRGAAPTAAAFSTIFFGFILAVGLFALVAVLADLQRRRSLRRISVHGGTVWVWTTLDGREIRSDTDPTPMWDKEGEGDGGADGSGDGGGGD